MTTKIVLTETAKADLREIALFIADQAKDKNVAIRFTRELQEKWKILEEFPQMGALPKDRVLVSYGFRFLVHKDYLIFYLCNEKENFVQIVSVFHAKRDYFQVMKKFV